MDSEPLEKYKLPLKDLSLEPLESLQEFKKVTCPSCNADVSSENININDKIAKCNHCNVVFPFHKSIASFFEQKEEKKELKRPVGVDVFRFKNELDIMIKQPLAGFDYLILFGLPILSFFGSLISIKKELVAIPFLLASIFIMILGVAYYAWLTSKHKMYININQRYLCTKRRPNKFIKDKCFDVNEIEQVYVAISKEYGTPSLFIIVNGIDGQKHMPLINGIGSMPKARYLEQEIERYLKIEDKKPEEL